jgi:galactose oxidase-like protein
MMPRNSAFQWLHMFVPAVLAILVANGSAGCGSGSTQSPPPIATHLSVTAALSTVTTDSALLITVNALDNSGGVVRSYAGTAQFTSTDSQALLPANTALSGGTANIQVTFKSSGTQTVTASDVAKKLSAGTSGTITVTGGAVLTVTSGSPPDGVAGDVYDAHSCRLSGGGPTPPTYVPCGGFPLFASGGMEPYAWSWTAAPGSSLPPGLLLSNGSTICPFGTNTPFIMFQICGRPTTAGTYHLVVSVSDSASPPNQGSANYTIDVTNPPPPTINTNPAPAEGAINLPYQFRFSTSGGLAPLTWSESGALPPGLTLDSFGTLSGTPTMTGPFPVTLMVSDSLGRSANPQNFTLLVGTHGFKSTGSMFGVDLEGGLGGAREFHTATLLQDGRVLVAGGLTYVFSPFSGPRYTEVDSAELYDPTAGGFSPRIGPARHCHTATLLTSGKVLITGGYGATSVGASAEIYDPASGTFAATTGSMATGRACHTATLLTDGKVLIAGGSDNTAELFDPATETFSSTGPMLVARQHHTATLLHGGKVLVTGGSDNSAELYDPTTGIFSATGPMAAVRSWHTATLLNDGRVLLTGGTDGNTDLTSAELYNPSAGTFSTTTGSMATARQQHTATLLNDGTVLVVGGYSASLLVERSAEVFDPTTGSFSGTGSLVTARAAHTATLLNDGTVLVTGGTDNGAGSSLSFIISGIVASAEIYQ